MTTGQTIANNLRACQIISGRDVERVAKQIDAAAADDTRRMDWLESQGVESVYFHHGKQMNPASLSLRAAIDLTPEPV